jgi:hypothetical protein
MSSGSPRTGPNPRLKRGLKKKLSIGQKSWIKGLRKTSRLNRHCHTMGRKNDTQTPLWTPTSGSLNRRAARVVSNESFGPTAGRAAERRIVGSTRSGLEPGQGHCLAAARARRDICRVTERIEQELIAGHSDLRSALNTYRRRGLMFLGTGGRRRTGRARKSRRWAESATARSRITPAGTGPRLSAN